MIKLYFVQWYINFKVMMYEKLYIVATDAAAETTWKSLCNLFYI